MTATKDEKKNETPFWLVWNPNHPTPPKQRYPMRKDAVKACRIMCRLFKGEEFYVLKAQSMHTCLGKTNKVTTTQYVPWGKNAS
jgi:hypothetical protein